MDPNAPPQPLFPSDTDAEPARIVVWALRHWICGHIESRSTHWSMVWQRLNELCGSRDGARAAIALEGIARAICRHAERPVHYHQPPCPCFGNDERKVVELIAACQQRRWRLAASWARTLVCETGTGDLIEPAARLGGLLAEHGQFLPGDDAPRRNASASPPAFIAPPNQVH